MGDGWHEESVDTRDAEGFYHDLEGYESPIEYVCNMVEGQVFIANGWQRPDGLCESAWESTLFFVMGLAPGAEVFYEAG